MIYRFTIISDEVDDFVREIQIDPEATFFDFHEAILKSVGYANDQMTSFFICDDDWEKEKEVTLEEMDDNPEIDSWVMKETPISELIEDEKQMVLNVLRKPEKLPNRLLILKKWPQPVARSTSTKTFTEIKTSTWRTSIRKVLT